MSIRKAVITAAGLGTRFLPATKSQPKETLPIVDTPMIQYVVEEALASGIQQIIIVTSAGKKAIAIEDYFDRSLELERALEQKGDLALLERMRRISNLADVCYVCQKEQRGLGDAVLTAKEVVGNEPFAVLLPDDIIDAAEPALKQMLRVYEKYKCSVVAIERVPIEDASSYGIIEPKRVEDRVYQVKRMIEKPPQDKAPSNMGIVGRYILMPEIFDALKRTKPGAGGEIQLTDALDFLIKEQQVYAYEFEGNRYDAGNPLGLLKASVELALKRPDIGAPFRKYLQELKLNIS